MNREETRPEILHTPNRRKWYVYSLAYPNGRVFYVGKGIGYRISRHEECAKAGEQSQKSDIIRIIWKSGGEVLKTYLGFFESEIEAAKYESSLIASLNGLVNIAGGRKKFIENSLSPDDISDFGASIRHMRVDGTEYWDGREVATFLGYIMWQNFSSLVVKTMMEWQSEGIDPSEDFILVEYQIMVNNGAKQSYPNYHFTKKAFYALTINARSTSAVVLTGKRLIAAKAASLT